jgi:hypothetical protein
MHEADEPNAVIDFLDAEFLAGQHGGDVDPFAMQEEPAADGDGGRRGADIRPLCTAWALADVLT